MKKHFLFALAATAGFIVIQIGFEHAFYTGISKQHHANAVTKNAGTHTQHHPYGETKATYRQATLIPLSALPDTRAELLFIKSRPKHSQSEFITLQTSRK